MKKQIEVREITTERTLVLIKPDAVMRGLVGQILQRFEQVGLKIVAMKFLKVTQEQLDKHFPQSEEWVKGMGQKSSEFLLTQDIDPIKIFGTRDPKKIGLKIKDWNYDYLLMGPVIAIVFEGIHAVEIVRKLVGQTLPCYANPGTIRGDFSLNAPDIASMLKSTCQNLIHASDSTKEAQREIECWFTQEELVSWQRPDEILLLGKKHQTSKKKGGKNGNRGHKKTEKKTQQP